MKMISKYSISILVLIRGQSNYLGECITALGKLKSSRFKPKAIFINDGACLTDYSYFQKYIDCIPYDYEYHQWDQKGVENSLNTILKKVNTQFFVRCDGDDILHSDYFINIQDKAEFLMIQDDICGIAPSFKIIEQNKADISYKYQDNFISKRFLKNAGGP